MPPSPRQQQKIPNLSGRASGKKLRPEALQAQQGSYSKAKVNACGSSKASETLVAAASGAVALPPAQGKRNICTTDNKQSQSRQRHGIKPKTLAVTSQNPPNPTRSKPQYTLGQPLPIHLFGDGHDPRASPYLIHLTYATVATQDSALARLSSFSESRDHIGQYLGLREIKDKGLRICKGYEGHNMAIENIAKWLEKMWHVEVVGACVPGDRAEKWWVEFCSPGEVQLIELLEEVGMLTLGFTNEAQEGATLGRLPIRNSTTTQLRSSHDMGPTPRGSPTFNIFNPSLQFQHPGAASKRKQSKHRSSKTSTLPVNPLPSPYIISHAHCNVDHSTSETVAHELAHFAYHSSPYYRALVHRLYEELSYTTRTYIKAVLVEGVGYAGEVCVDEWQAYLVGEGEACLLPDKRTRCVLLGASVDKKEYSVAHLRNIKEELVNTRKALRAEWDREDLRSSTVGT